jgi:tetratricopeptide (TPR) repeat protein
LENIESALLTRLSAGRLLVQLLELFFPNGLNTYPALQAESKQAAVVNSLALAHDISGEPGKAALFFERVVKMDDINDRESDLSTHLCNLALALWPAGKLSCAEKAIRRAMREPWLRTTYKTRTYGIVLAARGAFDEGLSLLQHDPILRVFERERGAISAHIAQTYLWLDQDEDALKLAESAWELAQKERRERDLIRAARLNGTAASRLGKAAVAIERLQYAVIRARAASFVQEELPALTALAELHLHNRKYDLARELLEQIWAPAEQGPYPLWHADARNVLAQLERDAGNTEAAIEAATSAYRLAWCDGPPYGYHYGLRKAQRQLDELNAAPPELPAFRGKIGRLRRWRGNLKNYLLGHPD